MTNPIGWQTDTTDMNDMNNANALPDMSTNHANAE
jgi:hypothetical protein